MAPAPIPAEIIWRNLEHTKRKKAILKALAILIEMVVLVSVLSVTLLFAIVEVVRDLYLTGIWIKIERWGDGEVKMGRSGVDSIICELSKYL